MIVKGAKKVSKVSHTATKQYMYVWGAVCKVTQNKRQYFYLLACH